MRLLQTTASGLVPRRLDFEIVKNGKRVYEVVLMHVRCESCCSMELNALVSVAALMLHLDCMKQ
jgi:hypothetical protein